MTGSHATGWGTNDGRRHMDRYQVRTSAGEPGIRTNSRVEAEKWAARWQTEVEEVED